MRFAIIGAGVIGRTHAACIAELAVAALDAGKHVIVEKPVDVTLRAARLLAAAEAHAAAMVTVVSQHRFDSSSQVVHRAIQEGRLGRLTSAVAGVAWWRGQDYYDSGDWRGTWALDGGGALMNQGIHTVDLLIWMLGRPVEVSAAAACLTHQRIEVEDIAVAVIRFASGALAVLHATTAAYPGLTARIQVHGDRGSAVIDGDRLTYFHAADLNQAADLLSAQARAPAAGSDPGALSDAHLHQYRDFVEAIEQGRRPAVTVDDAIAALAVVVAVYESAKTGKWARVEVSPRLSATGK